MPKNPHNLPSRAHIVHVLSAVFREGRSLDAAFVQNLAENHPANAEIRHWVYEVLRDWRALQTLTGWLLTAPLQKNESGKLLGFLLALGLQQLRSQSLPDYVVVNETVEACMGLQIGFAKKLVNAILQNYLRQKESLEKRINAASLGVKYSHPDWLFEKIRADWGDLAENILIQNQQHAPMHLRVNLQKTTRAHYAQLLSENNIVFQEKHDAHLPSVITLEKPVRVQKLPHFNDGWVSVQDIAPQWTGEILREYLKPNAKILDACAAPGNKTAHLLEIEPELDMTALDIRSDRLKTLQENLTRLNLTAKTHCADAQEVQTWWNGEPFDVILLDAPCSGSGVIRRHPDSKWLRRASDLPQLNLIQTQLFKNLWQILKPNGRLLYATCSIFHAENQAIVRDFVETHPDAEILPVNLPFGHRTPYGHTVLAGENGGDGFFYAQLHKKSKSP